MFDDGSSALQLAMFAGLTALIAVLTYRKVHGRRAAQGQGNG
jgi:hypothetical protein